MISQFFIYLKFSWELSAIDPFDVVDCSSHFWLTEKFDNNYGGYKGTASKPCIKFQSSVEGSLVPFSKSGTAECRVLCWCSKPNWEKSSIVPE